MESIENWTMRALVMGSVLLTLWIDGCACAYVYVEKQLISRSRYQHKNVWGHILGCDHARALVDVVGSKNL